MPDDSYNNFIPVGSDVFSSLKAKLMMAHLP